MLLSLLLGLLHTTSTTGTTNTTRTTSSTSPMAGPPWGTLLSEITSWQAAFHYTASPQRLIQCQYIRNKSRKNTCLKIKDCTTVSCTIFKPPWTWGTHWAVFKHVIEDCRGVSCKIWKPPWTGVPYGRYGFISLSSFTAETNPCQHNTTFSKLTQHAFEDWRSHKGLMQHLQTTLDTNHSGLKIAQVSHWTSSNHPGYRLSLIMLEMLLL
jgi:hypothetical protein